MPLSYLARPLATSSLLLGCSHAVPPPATAPEATLSSEYRTIQPDVSVSPPEARTAAQPAPLDPNADVMAEILAIPPGR